MKHVKIEPPTVVNFTQEEKCFRRVQHALRVFSRSIIRTYIWTGPCNFLLFTLKFRFQWLLVVMAYSGTVCVQKFAEQ